MVRTSMTLWRIVTCLLEADKPVDHVGHLPCHLPDAVHLSPHLAQSHAESNEKVVKELKALAERYDKVRSSARVIHSRRWTRYYSGTCSR
jgi:hypothetical protein